MDTDIESIITITIQDGEEIAFEQQVSLPSYGYQRIKQRLAFPDQKYLAYQLHKRQTPQMFVEIIIIFPSHHPSWHLSKQRRHSLLHPGSHRTSNQLAQLPRTR